MTLENIAWIVGIHLGTMHESQDEWAKKIKGPSRAHRVLIPRNLVYLVLHEQLGVSYNELAPMFNRKHLSIVSRCLKTAREWVKASPENAEVWEKIKRSVAETIEAEQKAHAETHALKV